MHELSLTLSVLDIIEQHAATHQFKKVNSIRLSLGRLSCIMPKAIEFAFDVQAQNTRAEGAKLIFDIVPATIHCFSCDKDSEIDFFTGFCEKCGASNVLLTGGTEELKIIELDVD